ncbi:hypothetical protein [Baekduia sp. Peel2402]|uniref:hypothetical protein n=1 Tax=Baekduia sp. Peel2402 TaxID=3458296 RepID=UPI00403ED8C7
MAYTLAYALSAPFLSSVFDAAPRRTVITLGALPFLAGNVLAAVAGGLNVGALGRTIGLGLAAFSTSAAVGVPRAAIGWRADHRRRTTRGAGAWRFLLAWGARSVLLGSPHLQPQ